VGEKSARRRPRAAGRSRTRGVHGDRAGRRGEAGAAAGPSAQWAVVALGVDFNGVHALSGLLLLGPAFIFARQPRWAVFYALYAAAALIITGVWALLDTQPAYVFTFPDNTSDGIFHLITGFLFLDIAVVQFVLDRNMR
jgi:hypothetical protein